MTAQDDKRFYVTFENWVEGDSFAIGIEDMASVPKDSYQAFNMQVYSSGILGVRPWLREHGVAVGTSAFGTKPTDVYLVGQVARDQNNEEIIASRILLQANNGAAYAKLSGSGSGSWTATQSITDHTGDVAAGRLNGNNSMDILDIHETETVIGGHRVINVDANTGTDLTQPSGFDPNKAAAYKSRMYVFGDTSDPYRVHYSSADGYDDLTTEPASFDIGVAGTSGGIRVEGLYSTSDALMLYRSDGIWHALTGASPVTGVLREIGPGRIPEWNKSVVIFKNQLMFLGVEGLGIQTMTPAGPDNKLDIIRPRPILRNQSGTGQEKIEPREAVASYLYNSVHFHFIRFNSDSESNFGQGLKAIDYVNEAFNMTGYWMTIEGADSQHYADDTAEELYGITMLADRAIVIVAEPKQAGATVPVVYTRDIVLDRPSRADDIFSDRIETDDQAVAAHYSAGQVKLRRQGMKDGHRVRVRRVIVDARYWKDASDTNWFPASMLCRAIEPDGTVQQMNLNDDWVQADLANTDFGGRGTRLVFTAPSEVYHADIGVELFNIQSMAIETVTVEYEIERYTDRG